jgi:hypothetical protein
MTSKPDPLSFGTPAMVDLSTMYVDHRYQREPKPLLIAKIQGEFNPDKFGALLLAKQPARAGELNAILDGQQRYLACRAMGWVEEKQKVPAVIIVGATPEYCAEIFETFNDDRVNVSPYEKWKSRTFRREPKATAINQLLAGFGMYVASKSGDKNPNAIRAIGTLESLVDRVGIEVMRHVIEILRAAWPQQYDAFDLNMLTGMTYVVLAHPDIDQTTLIRRMQSAGAGMLLKRAVSLKDSHSDALAAHVAFALVEQYNRRTPQRIQVKGHMAPADYVTEIKHWNQGQRSRSTTIPEGGPEASKRENMLKARKVGEEKGVIPPMDEPKTATEIKNGTPKTKPEQPRYSSPASLQDAWRNGRITNTEFLRQIRLFMEAGLASPNAMVLAKRLIKARRQAQ